MKVTIGKYKNWVGPYQIARTLLFFLPSTKDEFGSKQDHPLVDKFGDWLAEDKNGEQSALTKFCQWVENKRKRKIKVHIDPWDTWSMDHTLSLIIHPMLIQLKATKHGSPFVDDEDVPDHLRSTNAKPRENDWDTDEFFHDRWDWVMCEMIWAFGELANGKPGEDAFFDHTESNKEKDLNESLRKLKFDKEGFDNYQDRMSNAFRLFGKYYQGLWD